MGRLEGTLKGAPVVMVGSHYDSVKNGIIKKIEESLRDICSLKGVEYNIVEKMSVLPIELSKDIIGKLNKYSDKLGFKRETMLSGAGHDAMVMASITEVGLIFVPSKGGRSHCPQEWTDYEDLQRGVEVVYETIVDISEAK